jgi:23S rRNA pseudouridine2605 synthase
MKKTTKPGDGGRKPFKRDGDSPVRRSKPALKGGSPAKAREKNPDHIAVIGEGERISKIMARAGVASRRDCERMIMEGRVTLNGKVLDTPAINCTPEDTIEVDGQPINSIERTRLWIYYKPAGLVTTNHDPEGRDTVFDNLPAELPRVISVGRLDINTEGLLLLTNDGGLARMLELPTTGWLRRYRVRAHGSIDQARLDELKEGIAVDGIFYGAIEATLDREQGANVWITMGLREGKNREIKNVLGALGLDVNRLIRISYGPFQLGELEDGQVVEVKSRTLRDQLGPRLIAEANANFEAPIHNAAADVEDKPEAKAEWVAGRPNREKREDRRERDLSRIDTKRPERSERPARGERPARADRPDRGERPSWGDRAEREERPDRGERPARAGRPERSERPRDDDRRGPPRGREGGDDQKKQKRLPLGTNRTANVWMAPGARPVAVKKGKDEAVFAESTSKRRVIRLKKDGAEITPARELKPKRAVRGTRPETGDRAERPVRGDRNDRPPRASANRSERGDAQGERPARSGERKPRTERPAGTRDGAERPARSFAGKPERTGDRPARSEGARSERPRSDGDRPRKDGPRKDGPKTDGPRKGPPRGKGTGSGADRRR